jgi:hypothetical protein
VSEPALPPLVADLHVHYPMHVLSGDRDVTLGRMVRVRRRQGVGDKFRGAVLALASRLLNYRSWDAGPRVTVDFLAAGGVRVALSIGLILAQHQLNDGVRKRETKTFEESFEVIARHVDRLHEITGSHEHVGIGSDFDGFIKPTMGGLERSSDLARLPAALTAHYGAADAERMLSGNVLRVLRTALR